MALKTGLFYPALLVALTLPEICSGLELENSEQVKGTHYKAFLSKYCDLEIMGSTPDECYALRGGVIHKGNAAAHQHIGYDHFIFTLPNIQKNVVHNCIFEIQGKKAKNLDILTFCAAMERAVRNWYGEKCGDPLVEKNAEALLSLRPNGLSPFIVGLPLIASG